MTRTWKNIGLYFIVAQPTMFVCLWIIFHRDSTVAHAVGRLLRDLGAYVAIWVGLIWTALVIPLAFIVDRVTRERLSGQARRAVLIACCATLGFLLSFEIVPVATAQLLGCAMYAALFSMSRVGKAPDAS